MNSMHFNEFDYQETHTDKYIYYTALLNTSDWLIKTFQGTVLLLHIITQALEYLILIGQSLHSNVW